MTFVVRYAEDRGENRVSGGKSGRALSTWFMGGIKSIVSKGRENEKTPFWDHQVPPLFLKKRGEFCGTCLRNGEKIRDSRVKEFNERINSFWTRKEIRQLS